MYIAIYRFKLLPGREEEFTAHWKEGTQLFREEQGGLGSRLHRAEDGTYFAYAQWPSGEAYRRTKTFSPRHLASLAAMRACVAETLETTLGEITADLLVNLSPAGGLE